MNNGLLANGIELTFAITGSGQDAAPEMRVTLAGSSGNSSTQLAVVPPTKLG